MNYSEMSNESNNQNIFFLEFFSTFPLFVLQILVFRFDHFGYDKTTRIRELSLLYSFVCKCEGCTNDWPMWHEKKMPQGNITQEISYLSNTFLTDLNIEFRKIDRFGSILEENGNQYPCLFMFNIGLKLHRALTLKFGNISTELQVMLSEFFFLNFKCQ